MILDLVLDLVLNLLFADDEPIVDSIIGSFDGGFLGIVVALDNEDEKLFQSLAHGGDRVRGISRMLFGCGSRMCRGYGVVEVEV